MLVFKLFSGKHVQNEFGLSWKQVGFETHHLLLDPKHMLKTVHVN